MKKMQDPIILAMAIAMERKVIGLLEGRACSKSTKISIIVMMGKTKELQASSPASLVNKTKNKRKKKLMIERILLEESKSPSSRLEICFQNPILC
jgi:hypothetical protein